MTAPEPGFAVMPEAVPNPAVEYGAPFPHVPGTGNATSDPILAFDARNDSALGAGAMVAFGLLRYWFARNDTCDGMFVLVDSPPGPSDTGPVAPYAAPPAPEYSAEYGRKS